MGQESKTWLSPSAAGHPIGDEPVIRVPTGSFLDSHYIAFKTLGTVATNCPSIPERVKGRDAWRCWMARVHWIHTA